MPGTLWPRRQPSDIPLTDGIDQAALTVFQQRWWIEAAGYTGRYRQAQVVADGVIVGRLPYMIRRSKLGVRWAAAPDWTHLSGPVLCQTLSRAEKAHVLDQLMAQLPRSLTFGFVCPSHTEDADLVRRAFIEAGFVYSTETTYWQWPGQADALARVRRKHRLRLKAAAGLLEIADISADEFIEAYAVNLHEAGIKRHTPLNAAHALIARGMNNEPPQIRVMGARQKRPGAPLDAAIACVWDATRYYFWMSTRRRQAADDPDDKPNPDAIKLLIISAMNHARDLGLIFDADGVRTPGATTLYRDMLHIPNVEFRDVFERCTRLAVQHNIYVARIKQMVAGLRMTGRRALGVQRDFSR